MKWCTGSCGRELPLDAFDRNSDGYINGLCRVCERYFRKQKYRRRYRYDAAFRERERARSAARYARRRAVAA